MIIKKELLIDQRRFKSYVQLTVFLEKKNDDVVNFTSKSLLNGMLVQHPYKAKGEILPATLRLDVDLRPEEIKVEFGKNAMAISVGTLTAELLVKQKRVTGKYDDGDKIIIIKSPKDPLEENDLSILQLLVENGKKKK